MKYSILILFLISGCIHETGTSEKQSRLDRRVYEELTSDDIISIVIENWPHKVSNYCLDIAGHITFEYSNDLKSLCDTSIPCDACIDIHGLKINILNDLLLLDEYETIAHEYEHFFAHCADHASNGDYYHANPKYWKNLNPENSVEAKACSEIWTETRKSNGD